MLFGAIRLLDYILLIKEQIAWVARRFVLKKYIDKMVLFVIVHVIYYFTTFLKLCRHDAIDEWYRLLIQSVMFGKWYDKKRSNLMILDNSRIDYSRMLFVFVFLVYWKIEPNSRASGKTLWSRQSCQKNKMWRRR